MISLCEIMKMMPLSFCSVLRAEFKFETDVFFVTIYQGYPRLRREGFYLVCVHLLRAFARKRCTHTKDYFSGQLPAK